MKFEYIHSTLTTRLFLILILNIFGGFCMLGKKALKGLGILSLGVNLSGSVTGLSIEKDLGVCANNFLQSFPDVSYLKSSEKAYSQLSSVCAAKSAKRAAKYTVKEEPKTRYIMSRAKNLIGEFIESVYKKLACPNVSSEVERLVYLRLKNYFMPELEKVYKNCIELGVAELELYDGRIQEIILDMRRTIESGLSHKEHEVMELKGIIDKFADGLKQLMDYNASPVVQRTFDSKMGNLLYFNSNVDKLIDECIISGNTNSYCCNGLFDASKEMVEQIKNKKEMCKKTLEDKVKELSVHHMKRLTRGY